jgi:hypothetical protein
VSRHHPSILSLLEQSPRRVCDLGPSKWRRATATDAARDNLMLVCARSRVLLLHLCDVGLAASWPSTLLGLMAKLATIAAGVILCRLLVAGGAAMGASAGATLGTSSRPGLGTSACLARLAALAATR